MPPLSISGARQETPRSSCAQLLLLSHTLFDDAVVVGRSPNVAIQVPDPGVALEHLRIAREGPTEYAIEDLNSETGTFLNGTRITGKHRLTHGDRIRVGPSTTFVFEWRLAFNSDGDASGDAAPPPRSRSQAPPPGTLPYLDRSEFDRIASKGVTVAVHRTLLLDALTPIAALAALRGRGEPCFFLESARGGPRLARYSFLGTGPSKTIVDVHGKLTFSPNNTSRQGHFEDVFAAIQADCKASKAVRGADLPRFAGGWVGFAGWDVARGCVGLPRRGAADPAPADGLPDALYHRFDDIIVFDHVTTKIILISNVEIGDVPSEAWKAAQERLDRLEALLLEATTRGCPPPNPVERAGSRFVLPSPIPFQDQVKLAKKHLELGDIFQIVLSQTVSMTTDASPLAIYRALASINPSPYLLYLETGDGATIVGSSPEPLVRVQEGRVHVRPLAGTRRRGSTFEQDRSTEFELRDNEKELAEHLMLVDLGRNDVGRVARLGTVSVDEYLAVERYLHVMHLLSHVSGELDPSFSRFDAVRATFPAGTMSGAPKRRAVELIHELEGNARGLYAGGLGYIDLAGDGAAPGGLDMCIAIRCLVHRGREVLVRTGAGIVFDSDPELEHEEIAAKANSLLVAVRLAERGLRP